MKDKVFNFVIGALGVITTGSGIMGFLIILGTAGKDEMLSEMGKAATFNPLPGLAVGIGFGALAVGAFLLAAKLMDEAEKEEANEKA